MKKLMQFARGGVLAREGAYIPLLPRRSVSLAHCPTPETGGACLSQCESKRRAVATGQENVGHSDFTQDMCGG